VTRGAGNTRSGGATSLLPGPAGSPDPRRRVRRVRLLAAAVVAVAVAAGVVLVWPEERVPLVQEADTSSSPPIPWLSGSSGEGLTDGSFGEWRGRPVEIAGVWADTDLRMTELADLQPDGELADWDLPVDIAIGAIGEGESWSDAAAGRYDARWREALTELRELRGDRSGTTYVRFAHEMNGDWYSWTVTEDTHEDFEDAWRRFRELQQEVFPEAQLVFCVNRESVDTGMDWREFFPGSEYVDVLAVDYYNRSPYVETAQEWQDSLDETDAWGGPKGLRAHLDFAESVGLPLAVPEWSGDAEEGDSPAFVRGMHDFLTEHGGTGPGQVRYEIHFNVDREDSRFSLYDPYTRMPESAEAYQELW
jgi:hypothetical protein